MTHLTLDSPSKERAFRPGSQCFRILEWLRAGKTITPLQAMQMFNCYVLHSRIAELRAAGWDVKCRLVNGHGEYSL